MKFPRSWRCSWPQLGHELVGIHVWSEMNMVANALIRVGEEVHCLHSYTTRDEL